MVDRLIPNRSARPAATPAITLPFRGRTRRLVGISDMFPRVGVVLGQRSARHRQTRREAFGGSRVQVE